MGEKIFHILFILLPVSLVITYLLVRFSKIEGEKGNYFMVFLAIFGILTFIYLLFTI